MFTALILTKPQNLLMLLGLFGQGQTRGPSWLELIWPQIHHWSLQIINFMVSFKGSLSGSQVPVLYPQFPAPGDRWT